MEFALKEAANRGDYHHQQQQQHAPLANTGPVSGATASGRPPPLPPASDTGADAGSEPPANPRKRKKASRACDFCHVNHQPCDNGKPKCSVCTKHNKPCLYLRPTKRRGPQKGYRTALNTYKESAAAWGVVLDAIPGLDALIEGHLKGSAGKGMITAIKDSNQQEALITKWQQSSVFKAFFGHNGPTPTPSTDNNNNNNNNNATNTQPTVLPSKEVDEEEVPEEPPARPPPAKRATLQPPAPRSQSASSFVVPEQPRTPIQFPQLGSPFQPKDSASLSDIVAKDAAQAATRTSQTLASLGFAPDETIADFYSMGSNPEPIADSNDPDFDPSLGSESEQRAYYELLMGRAFPG
ncbi:hypothetical protein QBC40DRAFT_250431 [Triangularia verruculosa]|uniref:Zn(2)-C6 fungal-type domain-containing protein n=1 Tax=Triangularia verruculosa TaxID=2587418 RepID=A0AAN6XUX0_9PEZI|nr:hypothetical protein QBC40DRAFT_250431 [Triangularia verruculosa]